MTTGHVGCWPTSWDQPQHGRAGVGRARRQTWQTEAERAELEARVRDVVGLSLEPSAHAIVLCVDEKSQIQALERTPPSRPRVGAARRRHRRGAATHRGRLRALPMTGWAGERPACPHLRKLSQ